MAQEDECALSAWMTLIVQTGGERKEEREEHMVRRCLHEMHLHFMIIDAQCSLKLFKDQ